MTPPPDARIDEVLRDARARVDRAHQQPADAEWLLAHVLGKSRSWLYAHMDDVLEAEPAARFEAELARRIAGEPLAYITGRKGFWRFELLVTPDTLVPRPETELLVELAQQRLERHLHPRLVAGLVGLPVGLRVVGLQAPVELEGVGRPAPERHHRRRRARG